MILGGHDFVPNKQLNPWSLPFAEVPSGFHPLNTSFGTYGFAVPQANLQMLHDGYKVDIATGGYMLNGKLQQAISPDICFYNTVRLNSIRSTPDIICCTIGNYKGLK